MSGLVEAEGVDMFPGFAATELLMDGTSRRGRSDGRPAGSVVTARSEKRSNRVSTFTPR